MSHMSISFGHEINFIFYILKLIIDYIQIILHHDMNNIAFIDWLDRDYDRKIGEKKSSFHYSYTSFS